MLDYNNIIIESTIPIIVPGVAQWLRHCATSWKDLGSFPGGVSRDFSVAPDNSMCPGSTQPLKMSTRILLAVKTAGVYG
jgi:hypothetical protein